MSLTYLSLVTVIQNADNYSEEDQNSLIDYFSRLYLIPAPELFYPFLFSDIDHATVTIDRTDRSGLDIRIILIAGPEKLNIFFHRKRYYSVDVIYKRNPFNSNIIDSLRESELDPFERSEYGLIFRNPNILLLLLLLNKLPSHIANHLINYIFRFSDPNGNPLNLSNIETFRFIEASKISEWKMSNIWNSVHAFGLQLLELFLNENYPSLRYPIYLNIALNKYNMESPDSFFIDSENVSINIEIHTNRSYIVKNRSFYH